MSGLSSSRFGSNTVGALQQLAREMEVARDTALKITGLALVRQVKMTLSTPGRGRWYVRYTPRVNARRSGSPARVGGRRHRASAPNAPPAVDTGALRNSIAYEVDGRRHRVGSGMAKAPWLEYGTVQGGGKIAPRPFMRPALRALEQSLGRTVAAAIRSRQAAT